MDIEHTAIHISWSNRSLLDSSNGVWQPPRVDWRLDITVFLDGERVDICDWERLDGWFPGFSLRVASEKADVHLGAIATETGDVIKVRLKSADGAPHTVTVIIEHKGGWVISNPAWVDGINPNTLTCMQGEISDRLLALALGADSFPLSIVNNPLAQAEVPLIITEGSGGFRPQKSIRMEYALDARGEKTGWIIRPYDRFIDDVPCLSQTDWHAETQKAKAEWRELLSRHATVEIPDKAMKNAYLACFSDLFVMREKMPDGNYGVTCGTDGYRSTNPCEPLMTDILFGLMGYITEMTEDIRLHIDAYGKNGDWNSPKGWAAKCWMASGMKSIAVMEKYRLDGDRDFLEVVYPIMLASSRFNSGARAATKTDPTSPFYGLMPRGMGDGGMMNGSDYFGVFYPHNFYSVYGDGLTLEAAKILGKTDDIPELEGIFNSARADLLASIEKGAVQDGDYRYIPCMAGQTGGSAWYAIAPYLLDFLPFDHPLFQGTLKRIEKSISAGGLPLDLGWMKNGLWVAIALDNISTAYIKAGRGDEAVKYLYPSVNHASPLLTWCEERGMEKDSKEVSGDIQHLWTPLAVCRYIRDALCHNRGDCLVLASGTPREWLCVNGKIGINNACVYGGTLTYSLLRISDDTVIFSLASKDYAKIGKIKLYIRLPERDYKVLSADGFAFDGEEVEVRPDNEKIKIVIGVGK